MTLIPFVCFIVAALLAAFSLAAGERYVTLVFLFSSFGWAWATWERMKRIIGA